MTGAEHYAEAEWLIRRANGFVDGDGVQLDYAATLAAIGQGHATLALAAPGDGYHDPTQCPATVQHEDVVALLDALGIGTYARPYSLHDVIHRDVLPAVRRLAVPR